jgi:hypothetical protein
MYFSLIFLDSVAPNNLRTNKQTLYIKLKAVIGFYERLVDTDKNAALRKLEGLLAIRCRGSNK